MELDSRIVVLIVIPDSDPKEATPLQGFSLSLSENSWMVRAASSFPSSIFDFTLSGRATLIARRISGWSPINWFGQSPRALKSQRLPERSPFAFVLIPPRLDPSEYVEWAKESTVPPTIVADDGGDLTYSQLTMEDIQDRLVHKCDLISPIVDKRAIDAARRAIKSWVQPNTHPLGYQVGGHNSIAPNIRVLESAGFTDILYGRFNQVGQGEQPYVDQIVRTTASVLDLREATSKRFLPELLPETMDLNLFSPAIFPFVFDVSPPSDAPKGDRRRFVMARRMLERQNGYGFEVRTEAQREVIFGDLSEAGKKGKLSPHPLFLMRQDELSLATECIAGLAVSDASAVIRLPNSANRISGAVRNFAAARRSALPSSEKVSKTFQKVQQYLRETIPAEFLALIGRSRAGIRIVADAHLEWIDIEGLPLCIRHNVTRIPVTPGNLFVQIVAAHTPMTLTTDDFRDVLVINALDRSDEIYRAFSYAFDAFESAWRERLRVKFIDVSTKEELAAAINEFSGSIVVFDGHGRHEKGEAAQLLLKGALVDVWELKGLLTRVPPIVILSACDTHAADRNHATTGNGFLSLGVRTVLASVFPLMALDAAAFVARLLFRVAVYLPLLTQALGRGVGWNEVVSGMLRMQLLTDYLRKLNDDGLIDEAAYIRAHEFGNQAINGGEMPPAPEPFALVDRMLVRDLGLREEDLKSAFQVALASSSALSYIQLGRPETIAITTPESLGMFGKIYEAIHAPENG